MGIAGKFTLLDALYPHDVAYGDQARDPSQDVLVSQYGPGTTDHVNDCGPACILMVIKAMGLEAAWKQRVALAVKKDVAAVTVQDELDQVRMVGYGGSGDFAITPLSLRAGLEKVLVALGVPDRPSDAAWRQVLPMINEEDKTAVYKDDQVTPRMKAFLDEHCVDGSAVIVEGHPKSAAWGWGGTDDPNNARKVGDAGLHYVFVWRVDPTQEAFDVLDPSWTAPKKGLTIDRIVAFVEGPVGMFAVPYNQLAGEIAKSAHPAGHVEAKVALAPGVRHTPAGIPRLELTSTSASPAGPIDAKLIDAVVTGRARRDQDQGASYRAAMLDVWHQCDTGIPAHDRVQAYVKVPIDPTLKRATLGKIAALRARLELVLGWMLQGGFHLTATNWEDLAGTNQEGTDASTNTGTLVNHYTGNDSRYGLTGHDWCGMFVGFALSHAGLDKSSDAYFALASVPRALQWIAQHRKDGTPMTPEQIADGSATPQPGDVVVLEHHVSIVERFDPDKRVISTIDGNVGLTQQYLSNSVSGREYDVKHHTGPMKILMVYRPGLADFGGTPAKPDVVMTDNSAGQALVNQVDGACRQLTQLWQQMQLAGTMNSEQSVAEIAATNAK
jgi:hypothetical protein